MLDDSVSAKPSGHSQHSGLTHNVAQQVAAKVKNSRKTLVQLHDNEEELPIWDWEWNYERQWVCQLIHGRAFETFMCFIIVANMIVVVWETDRRSMCRTGLLTSIQCLGENWELYSLSIVILIVYIVELGLRIYVWRRKFHRSIWNLFDLIVVVSGLFSELAVLPGNVDLAVVRIFRMLRLVRIFRLLTAYRELYLIIHGFASTMRTIAFACVLLILLLTMLSILAVEYLQPVQQAMTAKGYFDDCPSCGQLFDGVWRSNLTFFQIFILADDWAGVAVDLIQEDVSTGFILVGGAVIIFLGFNNLIMSVIVEKAAEERAEDEQYQAYLRRKEEEASKRKLYQACQDIDVDGSGSLSIDELQASCVENPKFVFALQRMDVEREDLECVFELMDEDKSGTVSYREFTDTLFKMKRGDTATQLNFIKFHVLKLREFVSKELNQLHGEIASKVRNEMMESHQLSANSFGPPAAAPHSQMHSFGSHDDGPLQALFCEVQQVHQLLQSSQTAQSKATEQATPMEQRMPQAQKEATERSLNEILQKGSEVFDSLQERLGGLCSRVETSLRKSSADLQSELLKQNTMVLGALHESLRHMMQILSRPDPSQVPKPQRNSVRMELPAPPAPEQSEIEISSARPPAMGALGCGPLAIGFGQPDGFRKV